MTFGMVSGKNELLVAGVKGSRIILTTPSFNVVEITTKCQPHILKGLSDDDQRYAGSTNSAFAEIGKHNLERYGAVPLVIRTIANLIERSFFQVVGERCQRKELTCKMHDLVESEVGIESSIVDSNKIASNVSENCGHISIKLSLIPLFKGKKLCLHVLALYGFDFKMIPRSIHKLKHLRYLDLSKNFSIKSLPKSNCKIQNLQVLKLDRCYWLEELPKKIEKLVNLTHIGCEGCYGLTHVSRGIGKLSSLEILSMLVVDKHGSHDGADVSELRGLNNLMGELTITNLGFVKNAKEKFKAANLKEKATFEINGIVVVVVMMMFEPTMAESIAFDLSVKLITKLSSRALFQVGLWWNFKHDLNDLKRTVHTIKAVLAHAEEKSVTDNFVKVWLEQLKDVLYDADDLLDDFSTEALRKDLLGGNKLTKEVRLFFSSSNQFAYGLRMGREIKAIKARLASIQSEANSFNFIPRDRPAEISFMTRERRQTHSFVPKDKIIGRDHDKVALLKRVLQSERKENIFIIPIVGFGGLGKTALAQFVYNNEMVKNHFELMMWVCVSDVFDVKLIEWEQWVSLKELLVDGAKGSRIIVTTRSFKVAKITSKCQPHVLQGLSKDDAWSLFKEIAFEQRPADSTDSAFVEIGQKILERCGGVPLVIRTLASTLSYKETEEEWLGERYVGEGLTCKMHDLMHDLAVSVAGVESNILDSNNITSEASEKYRHISINASLIPMFRGKKLRTLLRSSNKGVQNFQDETWDFIISNCRYLRVLELHILNLKMIPCSIHKLKHLRYLDLSRNPEIKILPKSICKILNLQVLKLDLCSQLEELPKKSYPSWLTHMPRGIGKLSSLETLSTFVVDKNGSHGGADLSELRELNNLKGDLRIRNLGFVKNAKEKFKAANLKEKQHLRSLDLIWGGGNGDDDKSLEDLQPHRNLKELRIVSWRGDAEFPSWLSLLTNLVRIEICGSNFKHLPSFAQLPRLKELEIATKLEHMDDNSPKKQQPFFPSLKFLWLRDCPNMKSWWRTTKPIDDHSNEDDTTVMETSAMAFPCLSTLWIVNCPLTSMPLYPSVEELKLVNTSSRPFKQTIKMNINAKTPSTSTSSLPLSNLKSFTGLKKLRIENWKEVDLEGMKGEYLKNLLSLSLANFPNLTSLPEWIQDLKNLRWLSLINFPKLTTLPDEMRCLTNLRKLNIYVPQLEERYQKDIGADWYKIAHIPSAWSFH
ncbi:hypothetical protein CXB51_029483 [Gossypium anomalum]|uniref:NB-ARC domain-containing protein n=1 Tax=Gossypium anomalum TaxID=47600 RepID=A0A8J5Y048_9ROSI|nr:hypothetical protein CXB51_029483 [Gossypium anomalum]